MKCHLCSAWFEIRTDPENTRYVVVEGAKKQADEWDTEGQGVVQFKGMFLGERVSFCVCSFRLLGLCLSGVLVLRYHDFKVYMTETDRRNKRKRTPRRSLLQTRKGGRR